MEGRLDFTYLELSPKLVIVTHILRVKNSLKASRKESRDGRNVGLATECVAAVFPGDCHMLVHGIRIQK